MTEWTDEQKAQTAACYKMRLAMIEALEAGVYPTEVQAVIKDSLWGVKRFGVESVKSETQEKLARLL